MEGTRIRLQFGDDGQITASAGCNTIGSPTEVTTDQIIIGDLSTTEIGCDPPLHEQDEWLAGFLAGDPRYTLDGDQLQLRSHGTTIEWPPPGSARSWAPIPSGRAVLARAGHASVPTRRWPRR